MGRNFRLTLALLGIGLVMGSWYYLRAPKGPSLEGTRSAIDFSLKDRQGQTKQLSDFKGKGILLHFWATWCPPCIGELPHVFELAKSFEANDSIVFVFVNLDSEWSVADPLLPKVLPKNVVSLIDPELESSEKYGSYKFPETYLITRDFKIAMKWVGPQDWENERVKEFILSKL